MIFRKWRWRDKGKSPDVSALPALPGVDKEVKEETGIKILSPTNS